jgi:hypothetical protein
MPLFAFDIRKAGSTHPRLQFRIFNFDDFARPDGDQQEHRHACHPAGADGTDQTGCRHKQGHQAEAIAAEYRMANRKI